MLRCCNYQNEVLLVTEEHPIGLLDGLQEFHQMASGLDPQMDSQIRAAFDSLCCYALSE